MSPNMERVIGKAVTDANFRNMMLAKPEAALQAAGIDLTPDELTELKENIEAFKVHHAVQHLDDVLNFAAKPW